MRLNAPKSVSLISKKWRKTLTQMRFQKKFLIKKYRNGNNKKLKKRDKKKAINGYVNIVIEEMTSILKIDTLIIVQNVTEKTRILKS